MSLTGHELAEFLFRRYPAAELSPATNSQLDAIGADFADLAHFIADVTAVTPEQTLALQDLHTAHRSAIFAIVSHQTKDGS